MAIVLSENKKKLIKYSGLSPFNENFSRSYSGLNITPVSSEASIGSAVSGMGVWGAAEFFADVYENFTNTTYVAMYYGTEELFNIT